MYAAAKSGGNIGPHGRKARSHRILQPFHAEDLVLDQAPQPLSCLHHFFSRRTISDVFAVRPAITSLPSIISDGAAIAQEIADITIAAESLWELVRLRQLAMALNSRIRNIYRFVLGFNGGLIALGVAGLLPPSTSATLHNLSTLGISIHSMTPLPMGDDKETRKK